MYDNLNKGLIIWHIDLELVDKRLTSMPIMWMFEQNKDILYRVFISFDTWNPILMKLLT